MKEDGGDRGWVPVSSFFFDIESSLLKVILQSWFIGKVQSVGHGVGQVPPTPSVSTANSSTTVALDSDFRYASSDAGGVSFGSHGNQVSPMSSAFPPPSQASSRTVVM